MTKNQTIDMETTSKKAFQKLALNFGVLTGLFMILQSVIRYITGTPINQRPSVLFIIFTTLVIFGITYLAIFQYRKQLGGYLALVQAIKIGVAVALIFGIILSLWDYVLYTYIESDGWELLREEEIRTIEENESLSDDQKDLNIAIIEKTMTPLFMTVTKVLVSAFMGVIYSLVAGLILQKKKPIA